MEKQTLPNSTLILVFGIISIIGCCCYGIVGLIFGIIALVLANSATKTYLENPELYDGYQNVKIGKLLSIIGVVLSAISMAISIWALITYGGVEGMQEWQREFMEGYSEGYN